MAKHRLINCEFINASSFKVGVSNKGKLLYLMMLMNGDDRGFVDTTNDLINALTTNENELDQSVSLELLENTYNTALNELLDKGYLYEFKDNHNNRVHLVRHWFYHNKYVKGLWTNYRAFLNQVYLEDNEYFMGKKPLKEDKIKESNVNESKPIEDEIEIEPTKTKEESHMTLQDFLNKHNVAKYDELSEEQKKEWNDYLDSIPLDDDDLPF